MAMLLPHEKTERVVPSQGDESNWADREGEQRQGPRHRVPVLALPPGGLPLVPIALWFWGII